MATQPQIVHMFPSTNWEWRPVRIRPAPQAPAAQRERSEHRLPLTPRNPREMLTLGVTYRGGAECWWQIEARGRNLRIPGHRALHDVLWLLQGQVKDL